LSTDHFTQVTPDDIYVYEYDWTPDGKILGRHRGSRATAMRIGGSLGFILINAGTGEIARDL